MFFKDEEHCKMIIAAITKKLGGSVVITQKDFEEVSGKALEVDFDPTNEKIHISITDESSMIGVHTIQ